jgi:Leucine-rich repeat (LRR) protein
LDVCFLTIGKKKMCRLFVGALLLGCICVHYGACGQSNDREKLALEKLRSAPCSLAVRGVRNGYIEEIEISSVLSSADLSCISEFRNLKRLSVHGSGLDDHVLGSVGKLLELEVLELACGEETDRGLGAIEHLEKLREIRILGQSEVTDVGLIVIGKHKNLLALDLSGAKITDLGIRHLAGLSRLKLLNLSFKLRVSDAAVSVLKGFQELEDLNLRGTGISDGGVEMLSSLQHLAVVNLGSTAVTDAGLKELCRLPRLRELNLSSTRVTDEGIHCLSSISTLERLNLRMTKITGVGLGRIMSMKSLRQLTIGSGISTEVIEECQRKNDRVKIVVQ